MTDPSGKFRVLHGDDLSLVEQQAQRIGELEAKLQLADITIRDLEARLDEADKANIRILKRLFPNPD